MPLPASPFWVEYRHFYFSEPLSGWLPWLDIRVGGGRAEKRVKQTALDCSRGKKKKEGWIIVSGKTRHLLGAFLFFYFLIDRATRLAM
jgi:hypothetical protein